MLQQTCNICSCGLRSGGKIERLVATSTLSQKIQIVSTSPGISGVTTVSKSIPSKNIRLSVVVAKKLSVSCHSSATQHHLDPFCIIYLISAFLEIEDERMPYNRPSFHCHSNAPMPSFKARPVSSARAISLSMTAASSFCCRRK
jgi:hypothetical protein